jgi:NADH-quinone oxidoreductase subunit C
MINSEKRPDEREKITEDEKSEKPEKKKPEKPEIKELKVDDIIPEFPLMTGILKMNPKNVRIQNHRRIWIEIEKEQLTEYCIFLRENGFEHLSCILGVDYEEDIEVIYHLWSHIERKMISLKVRVSKEEPAVDSVTSIWKSADWHERETYDMLGVIFKGHPGLKRILLPDDFEGFPLRKDFKLEARDWFEESC